MQKIIVSIIFLACCFWYFNTRQRQKSNFSNTRTPFRGVEPSSFSNLDLGYLDQYEQHDHYRNNKNIWPIPYTATTRLFAVKRKEIAKEKLEDEQNPACAF